MEVYSCDTCERNFYGKEQYDKHMSEHRTCNLDGCQFTAHEKIIEKHILMQHASGLYERIAKVKTPEDIAKWIEERKKKYPSKENVEERYRQQEELLKKGIRLQKNPNKFGKDKFRVAHAPKTISHPRRPIKKKRRPKPPKKVSLIDEKSDWNGNMFPFKGTSELFKNPADTLHNSSDFEDDEWQHHSGSTIVKINNSLSSLMAAYGSDSDDTEAVAQNSNDNKVDSTKLCNKPEQVDSDNEPPEEVKIAKTCSEQIDVPPVVEPSTSSQPSEKSNKRKRPRQRFQKGKRLKQSNTRATSTRKSNDNFPHNKFTRRKVTLLERLLESEIRHERNLLLQCVRFTVQNNFFRDA